MRFNYHKYVHYLKHTEGFINGCCHCYCFCDGYLFFLDLCYYKCLLWEKCLYSSYEKVQNSPKKGLSMGWNYFSGMFQVTVENENISHFWQCNFSSVILKSLLLNALWGRSFGERMSHCLEQMLSSFLHTFRERDWEWISQFFRSLRHVIVSTSQPGFPLAFQEVMYCERV